MNAVIKIGSELGIWKFDGDGLGIGLFIFCFQKMIKSFPE